MKIWLPLLVTLFISACHYHPVHPGTGHPYRVPYNSAIDLHAQLDFHPDTVAIYIQNGHIINANTIDSYRPYCIFELRRKYGSPVSIRPGLFIIYKTRYPYFADNQQLNNRSAKIVMANTSVSHLEYETEMYLSSRVQSNMYKLTCKHWVDPLHARHLFLPEIQLALGDIATLRFEE